MKYSELFKKEPGIMLWLKDVPFLRKGSYPFLVEERSVYKTTTNDRWDNLTLLGEPGEMSEEVLELADGGVRYWKQVFLKGAKPSMRVVRFQGKRFEMDQYMMRARVETVKNDGEIQKEDSITSVYAYTDDENILFSIELKGEKMYCWFSEGTISSRSITTS